MISMKPPVKPLGNWTIVNWDPGAVEGQMGHHDRESFPKYHKSLLKYHLQDLPFSDPLNSCM